MIKTKRGTPVATEYIRVVHGGRGDYVEFSFSQINEKMMKKVLENTHEKNGFYDEYRTIPDLVKVYRQFGYVGYADYKPGMYYISPDDLDHVFPKASMKLEAFIQ